MPRKASGFGIQVDGTGGETADIVDTLRDNGIDAIELNGGIIDPGGIEPAAERGTRGGARAGAGRKPAGTGAGAAKPSAKNPRKEKAARIPVDPGMISFTLEYVGIFLSKVKHEEHWKFDADEKKMISEALAHALSFRNIPITPEAQAWLGVAGVCGTIVGGKVMASKLKKAMGGKPGEASKPSQPAQAPPKPFNFSVISNGDPNTD